MTKPSGVQEERSRGADKKSNLSPWCHRNQLLSSFISRTIIWASLVCLILVSGTVSRHKAVNSGGGVCVWGGSPSFHSTCERLQRVDRRGGAARGRLRGGLQPGDEDQRQDEREHPRPGRRYPAGAQRN